MQGTGSTGHMLRMCLPSVLLLIAVLADFLLVRKNEWELLCQWMFWGHFIFSFSWH